jgi:hypothetical protein
MSAGTQWRRALPLLGFLLLAAPAACAGEAATGAAAAAETSYDRPGVYTAEELVPPELLAGAFHAVSSDVVSFGYQYRFTVSSEFGQFESVGRDGLIRALREINALAGLSGLARSPEFAAAAAASASSRVFGARQLIEHPPASLSGLPQGAFTFLLWDGELPSGDGAENPPPGASDAETPEILARMQHAKRGLAAAYGVDPYSDNERLQRELNRLAWAAVLGGMQLPAASEEAPLVPAALALNPDEAARMTALASAPLPRLEAQLAEQEARLGLSAEISAGLADSELGPMRRLALDDALAALPEPEQRREAAGLALAARNAEEGDFAVATAQLLAHYNAAVAPLVGVSAQDGLLVGFTADAMILPFPADLLLWSPPTEEIFSDIAGRPPAAPRGSSVHGMELYTPATLTGRAMAGITRLGLDVRAP